VAPGSGRENRNMRNLLLAAIATAFVSGTALAAEPIDNCATMLGSLSVELRYARALPPGRATSFVCPKRFQPLLGASRERILRSLGPPDASSPDRGWSYFFAGKHAERQPGTPELVFSFDDSQTVSAIDCHRLATPAPPAAAAEPT
jgi:hypothetical protein